ncbi:hypothetical protein HY285_00785 [Candidatus Peregrinibacteria bacterium]|nr:hypothetical protein [Candidatus Peregrinibacteria bacterium]
MIANQRHIEDLAGRPFAFLEYFYTLDCRCSIMGMQHGRGMPTQENIEDLRQWCTIEEAVQWLSESAVQ